MFSFTKQEKSVLLILALIIIIGSSLKMAYKKYPSLRDMVNLIDSDKLYQKIDINKAPLEELVKIPFIGHYTAQKIVEYRSKKGLFTSVDQIKLIKGIREKNFKKFQHFIKISAPK